MLGKPVVAPEGATPPVQPETTDSVIMHNAANLRSTTPSPHEPWVPPGTMPAQADIRYRQPLKVEIGHVNTARLRSGRITR